MSTVHSRYRIIERIRKEMPGMVSFVTGNEKKEKDTDVSISSKKRQRQVKHRPVKKLPYRYRKISTVAWLQLLPLQQ